MDAQNSLCEKMLRYIHQHYNEPLTLARLASIFYMNQAYLGRMFSKNVGVTFNEYLKTYRIKMAMQMLSRRNMSVLEVSKAVGYQNLNYFFRVFKMHVGATPSEFRAGTRRYVLQNPYKPLGTRLIEASKTPHGTREGVVVHEMTLDDGATPGDMVELKPGVIRYYYISLEEDQTSLRYVGSMDDGLTWSERGLAFEIDAPSSAPGLSMQLMMDGSLGVFYVCRCDTGRAALIHRRSYDDGINWTPPKVCLELHGHALLEGRMCRLSGGRLILPASRPSISAVPELHQRGICHFISDDDGESWRISPVKSALNCRHSAVGFSAPTVIERTDGKLRGFTATDLGCQYSLDSEDAGECWTNPQPSILTSAPTPMHIGRLSEDRLIAVWNPIPDYNTCEPQADACGRSRLIYCLSDDDGASWGQAVIIENCADAAERYGHPVIHKGIETVCAAYLIIGSACEPRRLRIRCFLLSSLGEGVYA